MKRRVVVLWECKACGTHKCTVKRAKPSYLDIVNDPPNTCVWGTRRPDFKKKPNKRK